MAAKKPAKPTRLQVKADKKNRVLIGPKGSKPQSTTTNRVRTQGGTTMTKPKPAPSAGRRINPKAAKPAAAPAKPSGPVRSSIGNVRGPGGRGRPASAQSTDARRWQELNKQAARNAPKPTPPRTPAPGTGNVERTAIQRGQAMREQQRLAIRQERLSRNNLGRPISRGLSRGAAPTAIAGALLNTPAEIKKLQALLKDPGGTVRRASNQFLSGNTNRSVLGATKPTSKPSKPSAGGAQGPSMPSRLREQGYAAQEKKARQRLEARKKATGSKEATPNTAKSFDSAFKDARRAGVKTFTWRGKKYTTEMK